MKILEVNLPDRIPHPFDGIPASIPVAIPDLDKVIQFGLDKHGAGESWQGTAFGWPAEYRPSGNLPEGFYIGVNGIYFVALD